MHIHDHYHTHDRAGTHERAHTDERFQRHFGKVVVFSLERLSVLTMLSTPPLALECKDSACPCGDWHQPHARLRRSTVRRYLLELSYFSLRLPDCLKLASTLSCEGLVPVVYM